MIVEEKKYLLGQGSRLYGMLLGGCIPMCMLFGVYVLALLIAVYISFEKGVPGRPQKVLWKYMILLLVCNIWNFGNQLSSIIFDVSMTSMLSEDHTAFPARKAFDRQVSNPMTINKVVGDGIIVWGAWEIWNESRVAKLILVVLMMGNIGTNVVDMLIDVTHDANDRAIVMDYVASAFSLAVNFLATLLIALKTCDGKQPKCSACKDSLTFSDCDYNNAETSQILDLKEQIFILENRLKTLESGRSMSNTEGNFDLQQTGSEVHLYAAPSSGKLGFFQNFVLTSFEVQLSPSGFEDLPQVLGQMLMHNFIHKTCSVGFFLHKERFRRAVFQSDGERPTFALLNTSYLWGMHLSASVNPPEQEAILISRALQSTDHALSEHHPQKVLQCVQSLVLLANYFYRAGRIIEGRYHATRATSLVLSNGLHQIRTDARYPQIAEAARLSEPLATIPCDAIEECERINAFWAVLITDAFWNTVHGLPSGIPYTSSMARVDTPWPRLMEEHLQAPYHPDFRSSSTIGRFLSGAPDKFRNNSAKGNSAKAAVLFERATFIGLQAKQDAVPTDPALRQVRPASFNSLAIVIRNFIQSIPPMRLGAKPSINYLLCMMSLAHAAEIQLHLPLAAIDIGSRSTALRAAKAIVDLIDTWVHSLEVDYIDPMLSIIWTLCCRVFLDESKRLRTTNSESLQSLPFTESEVRTFCERVIAAMQVHSFPLMDYQLRQVTTEFQNIYGGIR
ncbi:hypothetical protein GYMLUDRAFT_260735 [Collybiopsis luxurians FD-317 M1]|uniref:Xylanolytic transcriptional activator regulatory domain-containing protein n=1 Tax=Collybiopsis luxurians FD-317 M1 TaxID=944289 RepID=A0A0D0CGE5_9AGAR|nr:hypothetical protein GYMLUDRAFT_260735 [Collybiopsis luxurians FD-317 M1]